MKRDMDLIRLLLLRQETEEEPPELAKYDEQLIVYNIALMIDAGLVEGQTVDDAAGTPIGAIIMRMTWAGHDFLDSTKDPTIWAKAKEHVIKPGASWTFALLGEYLKSEVKSHLGLP